MTNSLKSKNPKMFRGIVVSDKMKDTAIVAVLRFVKIPKYGKYTRRTKRYMAHDAGNLVKVGERVSIIECHPISKKKRFTVIRK